MNKPYAFIYKVFGAYNFQKKISQKALNATYSVQFHTQGTMANILLKIIWNELKTKRPSLLLFTS